MKTEQELLVSLLGNTGRSNNRRNISIYQIAENIIALSKIKGGIKNVAGLLGISTGMLNKFLSVKKLSPEVLQLVKERKIDSVEAINIIAKFPYKVQKVISEKTISHKLSSQDIR